VPQKFLGIASLRISHINRISNSSTVTLSYNKIMVMRVIKQITWNSSLGIVTKLRAGYPEKIIRSLAGAIFFFSTPRSVDRFSNALGPIRRPPSAEVQV
jgi:hypothetical protein